MSVVYSSETGSLISHEKLINRFYSHVENAGETQSYTISSDLFKITHPFKKVKHNLKRKSRHQHKLEDFSETQETVDLVEDLYRALRVEIQSLLQRAPDENVPGNNEEAIELSKQVYDESGKACIANSVGENRDGPKRISIDKHNYVFPANCKFFCKDVVEIGRHLTDVKFDLIVLDPPWWNKYVRRKKAKTDHGYKMMYNDDLKEIPVQNLLHDDGLVVVWCTNSLQHLQTLQKDIFAKWKVQPIAKWYWLKITNSGEPICGFSKPPGKQPFEQIILGCRNLSLTPKPQQNKLVVSVPSALHSHKPPLTELLQQYLPENPKCLELFARYLLPNWTSWGLEALRFQHESLYKVVSK